MRNASAAALLAAPVAVKAAPFLPPFVVDLDRMSEPSVVGLSLIVGLVLFSTIVSLLHLTARKSWTERERDLVAELDNARAGLDRAGVFLAAEPQITIVWGNASGEPEIEGDLGLVIDAPVPRRVLGFGAWLAPHAAQTLEASVARLRTRGEGFRMSLVSLGGRHIEAEGRAVSGRAVLRLRDVSGDRMELMALRRRHAELGAEAATLRDLLDRTSDPAWIRDDAGRIVWANAAYARGVEARDAADVVARQLELLERDQRQAAARSVDAGSAWRAKATALIGGQRHPVDILVERATGGVVGVARDRSEIEALRVDLERRMESHARTLDQLATAVATFDSRKQLVFHNAAYRQLWQLDQAFLDQRPTDIEILDRLRAAHRLPEEADFRKWRATLHAAYQSVETATHAWHLPDGRTLRVVVNPDAQSGVTYLFDDVTEQIRNKSQVTAMERVRRETLDTLRDGVAVFGTDARLELSNPAFAELGGFDGALLAGRPRFDALARAFAPRDPQHAGWDMIRAAVTGLRDERTPVSCRIERADGSALDCVAAPLPDGATLVTFADVTAQVNVERALTERNTALLDAANLRNDFVHHVSYELRSPLTAITGFIQMLSDGTVGPLTPRQLEYAGYVRQSSDALLAIIDDILDLATIDRDALELELTDVDIRAAMATAKEGVADRLTEWRIDLRIIARDEIGAFRADARRLRQILYNLLSNAIGFSSPGQTVTLAALRRDDAVVFKVTDQGRGIPADVLDKVFDRFHTHTVGSRHRGAGLGLSIVRALVERHGGEVTIATAVGEGTTVTCIFPTITSDATAATPAGRSRA